MLSRRMYRNFVLVFTLAVSLLLVTSAYALNGGPDRYGYRYIDSLERGGPQYSWYKVVQTPEFDVKGEVGNTLSRAFPIGFEFEFYGKKYSRFQITANGYILFYASRPNDALKAFAYNGEDVPSAAHPNGMLAPLWGDNNGVA